ncbi:hypothetical protein N7509_002464 [Penicillium cosmopolitanum]|uniref:Proline racemase n=1 Tax=Penicillium cosmopolitanum TaxID=1131564 RepID=A0A9W9W8Z5_9EURO|nr:uncharacterized protein N7509_002464 [Penicillium cosmopolitanum]KAJ5408581.1 hypothetical protein N7509_002464 [Penicillium cosmopolitanum]
MPFSRSLTIVGCHSEGEVGDVITGGVLDVPGKTMYEKLVHFETKEDGLRQLLLNEPRGRASINTNLILPACDPRADVGFLIMESKKTGMIPMKEPFTEVTLDTAAGLVTVTAECEAGKCKSVEFNNVPSFVFELDYKVMVPGIGQVSVDIAYGGMMYVLVDAASLGLMIDNQQSRQLVEIGERIKRAVEAAYTPIHPENSGIKGFSVLEFTEPLRVEDGFKVASNAVVVSPGRFDRSPCGVKKKGEIFKHRSIIGTEFVSRIRGTTKVGEYPAVLPTVKGRAWITSFKQVVLDSTDPFPQGFRVGDQWHIPPN